MNKTAILLYGYMRTYKKTSHSLLDKIVKLNCADVFVFTYSNEGVSKIDPNLDINVSKNINAAEQDKQGEKVTEDLLKQVYGESLVSCKIEDYDPSKFKSDSANVFSPILPIDRIFSLYYNINKVVNLLSDYEKAHNMKYENVLITRPDLLFYSEIDLTLLDNKDVYVPTYGGNIAPPLKSLINISVVFTRMLNDRN